MSVLQFKTFKNGLPSRRRTSSQEPGVKTSRVRSSLDSKDRIPIYQVATAFRDIKGNDFKEDRPIGAKIKLSRSFVEFSRNFNFSFSCS